MTFLDSPREVALTSCAPGKTMPPWWNGRHCGFKIRCFQRRTGSNPVGGMFYFFKVEERQGVIHKYGSVHDMCRTAATVAGVLERAIAEQLLPTLADVQKLKKT